VWLRTARDPSRRDGVDGDSYSGNFERDCASEALHPCFGGVIGDIAGKRLHRTGSAADVDNAAVSTIAHRSDRRTCDREARCQGSLDAVVPSLIGGFVDICISDSASDRDHACIVDADVESSAEFNGRSYEIIGNSSVHQVADDTQRPTAERSQFGGTILDPVSRRTDHNVGATLRQGSRDREADAKFVTSARHKRNLASQCVRRSHHADRL
jgi:hypothetical protein